MEVKLPGYQSYRERVWIRAGKKSELRIVLTPTLSTTPEPAMVFIKGACFQMGSPESEEGRDKNETQHNVCVKDFYLGKYEVTVGEFRRFIEATGYKTDAERNTGGETGCWAYDRDDKDKLWNPRTWANWRTPNKYQANQGNHPVACVSWSDALAYIEWLSEQTGEDYRLPTEAEWEYAARAGTTTARYWGDDPNMACTYANVLDLTLKQESDFDWEPHHCDDDFVQTAPIGQFKPNEFELYDMLGNVLEWTCSEWGEAYKGQEQQCIGNNDVSTHRVIRGGSWYDLPHGVRSAFRLWGPPALRYNFLGFRLAKPL